MSSKHKNTGRDVSNRILAAIGMAAIAVINLVPFLWGALTSLKTAREVAVYPPRLFGSVVTGEHYQSVLKGTFGRALINSSLYSVAAIVLGVLCALLIAYALTRFKFRGKRLIFLLILFGIPLSMGSAAMVVPNYMMLSSLHMVNRWFTLPLIYTAYNLPMAVWIMIGGMQAIPYAIEEAALIDGASRWYVIFRLIPRLSLPTMACAALMIFIGAWNEYTVSSVMINSGELYPIQVSIYNYIGFFGQEWGPLTAAATLAVVPILLVFTYLGKFLVSGLVAGAVKG